MSFDVHDCIAFITNHGGKLLDESMNRMFAGEEITRTQWTALYYIGRTQNITLKELAADMMISEPSATNLVNRMESSGLVERSTDKNNARMKRLTLTELGKKKLDELAYIPIQFNETATKGISEDDLDTFKRVLDKMIDQVEK